MVTDGGRLRKFQLPMVAFLIIPIYIVEKLANVVIIKNLIFFLMDVEGQSLKQAAEDSFFAEAITSATPSLGLAVANLYVKRRFLMTLLSSKIYIMGLLILTMRNFIKSLKDREVTLVISALIISVGMGGLTPCIEILYADQFYDNQYQHMWNFFWGIIESIATAFFVYFINALYWRYTHIILVACMVAGVMLLYPGRNAYGGEIPKDNDKERNLNHHINIGMLTTLWLTCAMFGVAHAQTSTFFAAESETMYVKVYGMEVPPSAVYCAIGVGTKYLVTMLEKVAMPVFRRTSKIIFILQRVALATIITFIGMTMAIIVAKKRLAATFEIGKEGRGSLRFNPISVFWIIPQLMLLETTDAIMFIGIHDYFLEHAPSLPACLADGFYMTANGAGSLISLVLMKIADERTQRLDGQSLIGKDVDLSRLDYFYTFVTGIIIIVQIVLFFIAQKLACPDRTPVLGKELVEK